MLNMLSSISIFLLMTYCSLCNAQPESDRYKSFIEQSEIIRSTVRTYELYSKDEKFYLTATRSVESNRFKVLIYDIETAKVIADFQDQTDFMDSIERAGTYLESQGFNQVRPNIGKLTTRASPMSQDGYRSYNLGTVHLVTDRNDTCSSSFNRSFSVWDSSGEKRLKKVVPMVVSKIEHAATDACEKMYGHQSEKLDYMGLALGRIWPLGGTMYGVSLTSVDSFFILDVASEESLSFKNVNDLLFLDYDVYAPLYSKYYSACYVNYDSNETTLDECISSFLKGDKVFQQLLN